MGNFLIVRASQLDRYRDCGRSGSLRFAEETDGKIRSLSKTVQDQGHVLAETSNSIAAAQGTSLHAMMAELFKQKLGYGQMNLADAFAVREQSFMEEVSKGVIWDATTPHIETAKAQVLAMARALLPIAEMTDPLNVEDELVHDISPLGNEAVPIRLVGHRDLRDRRFEIHDHKTGTEFPACYAQLGAYAMLTLYKEQEVSAVRVNYAPRLPMSRLHETQVRSLRLDVDDCMKAAWSTLLEIQTHYMRWLESGSPWSFPANPYSQTCTPKYCKAYGTGTWCTIGAIQDG